VDNLWTIKEVIVMVSAEWLKEVAKQVENIEKEIKKAVYSMPIIAEGMAKQMNLLNLDEMRKIRPAV
jgi:hypothetical protein